ncbi:repeat protein [Moumouvirus goulette]|uniref:Repeat protein n=1 Tax=Moumouvirus goulette TaxID=1247379 RepID=M1PNX7_9VIRU|nr:repeat protein [Moumouvirus goulette]AGF85746.1 repeat protein [Moumouvirus goulette]
MKTKMYFKITNKKEKEHFGFQYKEGLNVLQRKFNNNINDLYGANRLYFFDAEYVCNHIDAGIYLREIYLPIDNPKFKIIKIGKHYGANMIIFGEKYFLGDPKTWKYMISKKINIRVNDDYVIKYVASMGYLNVMKYLHKHRLNIRTDNDYALTSASITGHLEVVKYLVDNGADIHRDDDDPLECACRNGHFKVVKYLVKNGANVNACDDCALKWAVSMNHIEIVKYLIKKGANIYVDDGYVLKLSLSKGNLSMITYLVSLGLSLNN